MSVDRIVTYAESPFGIWDMTCADCPLRHHAVALALPPPQCMSGIATNMQGHITLKNCQHLQPGSCANGPNDTLTILCHHAGETTCH